MDRSDGGVDKEVPLRSPLARIERSFIDNNIERFPPWIEGYHLTLMTIPLTLGLIGFGWLSRFNIHWLWLSSLMVAGQWFTDSFDGALGRHRDTGIPKWGFYMDHFLDFLFMSAIFIGYAFTVSTPASQFYCFILMLLYGTFMASAFLSFGATNLFKITYLGLGPIEVRLLFIVLNTFIILMGIRILEVILPYALGRFCIALAIVVYQTQREIWKLDMKIKAGKKEV
jgi:phosphatidylglycerophosphate synthase